MPRAHARSRAAVATAAIALAALAGCASAPAPSPTPSVAPTPLGDGVLRIGTLFPASGALSFLAPAQVAGVNAAVREINAAGGVNGAPVEVVSRDSGEASTQKAEESFADLVNHQIDAVIGPSSSAIAQRLLAPAGEAGVVLVSPAATYPQLTDADTAGLFFRTIPSYGHQGAVLAEELGETDGVERVAVVHLDDELGRALLAELEAGAEDAGIEVVAVEAPAGSDAAAVAAAVTESAPQAVVLATPDNGDQTKALIAQLVGAGFGGGKLWLTSQNLADYSQALPGGMLAGARGILEGADVDEAFAARLKQEDPQLGDLRYAAEAYDATILVALAATIAGDDAGGSIAFALRDASVGGIKCTSYAECLDVLQTQPDIDYDGISGNVNLDAAGDRTSAFYAFVTYTAENKTERSGGRTG